MSHHPRRLPWACLLALPLLAGCAVFNRDNTPTLNLVHDHLVPESSSAKYFALPLVFPLGLVAVTADMFVVHPVTVAGDAVYDTRDAFWKSSSFNWKDRYVTECAVIVPRAALSPLWLIGAFLARSSFDIPRYGTAHLRSPRPDGAVAQARQKELQERNEKEAALLAEARKAYDEGRYEDALAVLAKRAELGPPQQYPPARHLEAACLARLHRDVDWPSLLPAGSFTATEQELLKDLAADAGRVMREGSPANKLRLLAFLDGCRMPELLGATANEFPAVFAGQDRALAMRCVMSLGQWMAGQNRESVMREPPENWRRKSLQLLESVAQSSDPTIAAAAQLFLLRLDSAGRPLTTKQIANPVK